MTLLLLINAAATIFMFGVIVTVQIVHYPLFAIVGDLRFVSYHREHMRRIGYVVVLPMVVELASSAGLVLWRPTGVSSFLAWTGLVLVILIWLSTWLLQVPQHSSLMKGFDGLIHARLLRSNWIRTFLWGARSILALLMIDASMPIAVSLPG